MTKAQLVQECIDRGYNYVETARIGSSVDRANKRICARRNWPFLEKGAAGPAPLELTDLAKVLSVLDTSNRREPTGVDRRWLLSTFADLSDTGTPVYWYLEGNTLKTYPVDESAELAVRYKKRPASLSDTDEPEMPEEWQYLIVDLVVVDLLKDDDEGEEARALKIEVEEGIREMANDLLGRNHQNGGSLIRTGRPGGLPVVARYEPLPFHGFGKGLNLRDKPDAVDPAECIDAMDVLFSDLGAIQQRPGYDSLTSSALTNRVGSLEAFYTTAGTKQLLAGCGTRLEALNTSGGVVQSATGLTSAVWDFARFGKPNAEVAYAGNGTDTLRKWNGTEWSAPTATVDGEAGKAMPKAGSLAVWAEGDNRLVATRFSTATGGPNGKVSSPSHVYFSDPGDPESYEGTAFVQLSPGDGEAIQAAVVWRELLFVFKETKFFVFDRGVADDAEGKPEFFFRAVEAGVGMASPRAVYIHPSGVYFMSRQGVYVTTGQEPELVSSLVEPIWTGDASAFYTGGTLAHGAITNCAMGTYQDRIYLSFPTDTDNDRTLVYDPQFQWWSLTSLPCSAMTTFRPGSTEELVFGYASGENHVGRHSSAYTNDDGTAISSHWRSGWSDLGSSSVKKIRAQKVWGAGKVGMAVSHDFRQGVGTLTPLDFSDPEGANWGEEEWGQFDWAEPKVLSVAHRRVAARGTVFSVYFENRIKDQSFAVHRLEHLVPEVRDPARGNA